MTSFETAAVGSPALLASAPARVAPAPPAKPVIEARSLSVLFEAGGTPVQALSDVDLTVRAGEFVSLIGPSGCGKTTLLRVIADLERATSGTVTVNGLDPRAAREARQYGYVFQAPALLPWRTVLGNVTLPLEIAGLPRAERRARALEELRLVELDGLRGQVPLAALRRHAAAGLDRPRAQPSTPGLLLMDEPFGALDEITRDRLNLQLPRCCAGPAPPASSSPTRSRRRCSSPPTSW